MVGSGLTIEKVGPIPWYFIGRRCDSGTDHMPMIPFWYGWVLPSWHERHIRVADVYVPYV